MKLLKTMMIGVLGTATLLPTLPAWAEAASASQGAANAGSPTADPTRASPAPASPAPANPANAGPANAGNANADSRGSGNATAGSGASATGPAATGKTLTVNGGMHDRMRARRDDRKAFFDARLAALHAGLQLTPAQKPLWGPVEAGIRDLARARHNGRRHRDEDMTGTERLKMRSARLIAVGQALGKLADATGPLVDALTPEQKNRLPVLLRGIRPHQAVVQAFGVENMMEPMGRPWHDRFRDGDNEFDMRRGDNDRDMDRGGDGRHFGWDRDADRFGPDHDRFDEGEAMFRHHHARDDGDERMGD